MRPLTFSKRILTESIAIFALLFSCGCNDTPAGPATAAPTPVAPVRNSPHGGLLVSAGDLHVEIASVVAPPRVLVYLLGADAVTAAPLAPEVISAQIKLGAHPFQALALKPAPLNGESAELCSKFEGVADIFQNNEDVEIVIRIRKGADTLRAHALLNPADVAPHQFICPMKCNSARKYAAAGMCPVCGMALVETHAGVVEHTDHQPKHGGVFFMSADNWHHLEGVLIAPDEFQLYLYDNFTRPLAATGFDGAAEFSAMQPITVKLSPGPGDAYLRCGVPPGSSAPIAIAVRIRLKPELPPELFNFFVSRAKSCGAVAGSPPANCSSALL